MPELPEVETTVKGLNLKALNRAFVGLWTDIEKFKKLNGIKGKKIIKIYRRGKNIIFDLNKGYSLLIHQKMTGHLLYGLWELKNNKWEPIRAEIMKDRVNTYIHLIFYLDNGKMLALSDLRKFAKAELWKTEELLNSEGFKKLGPEPLDKSFSFEKFKERIKNKKGKIKQVLMDQEVFVGVGNIYSDEALWIAKINPLKKTSELSEKELKNLFEAVIKVLKSGIKLGGESFAEYRNIDGEKGNFDNERKAYKREGEKCSRCGSVIKRIKIGGRSAHFCPNCQMI